MPIMRDCGNAKIIVTLHLEIGDVHQLAADVDYFFRARMLRTLSLGNQSKGKSLRSKVFSL